MARKKLQDLANSTFSKIKKCNSWLPFFKKSDLNILKKLSSNKNLIISKPDKGKGIVILNKDDYINKMHNILDDTSKFKIINQDTFKLSLRLKDKINIFLNSLKEKNIISNFIYKNLYISGSSLGLMYGLPKVHKPNIPLRPIVATYNTANYKLAKFLIPLLSPLVENDSIIKNSYSFVKTLKTLNPHHYMISYDVVNLYTNIPTVEAISIIIDKLFPNDDSTYHGFTKDAFKNSLEMALLEKFFIFNDNIYQQIDGLGMGSPLAQIIANIFLLNLEEKFLKNCPKDFAPTNYFRYVDDTFVTFNQKEHGEKFLEYINNAHPQMKFTMEIEENKSLKFLDMEIHRKNNKFETSIHRKNTFTGLGMNFFSACPLKYKLSACKSLIFRAYKLCSNYILFHQELEYLREYFRNNNFNEFIFDNLVGKFINNIYKPITKVPSVQKLNQYCKFPYLGELNTIFQKDLQSILDSLFPCAKFTIVSKNPLKISSYFHMKSQIPKLLRSNIIYLYSCPSCKLDSYIGSTTRPLKVRICEHMGISHRTLTELKTKPFSAIRMHSQQCKNPISFANFSILDSALNENELLIKESIYIKQKMPTLNKDQVATKLYIA